jgi:predicted metal-dependent peptidase
VPRRGTSRLFFGLYLPGVYSDELGEVVIAVDCSGSIRAELGLLDEK